MCLQLTITPLDKRSGEMHLSDLAVASGLDVTRHKRGVALTPVRECGCGFAADGRQTDPDWRVRQDLQVPLMAAIEFAAETLKRFRFTATWMDTLPGTERTVTVDELSHEITHGTIANRAFIVRAR